MLSEDERKSIQLLTKKVDNWNCKRPKNPLIFSGIVDEIDTENNAIRTVLNLITKLQKENEDIKSRKEHQKIRFKRYKENIDKQHEEIYENLVFENEKYKYLYQKALDNTVKADKENMQLKKQIDLMAEYMEENMDEYQLDEIYEKQYNCNGMERNWTRGKEKEVKDIKQYFEKLVKEKGK